MSFIWPLVLFSLLLIPIFIGLYLRAQQRRKQLASNFGNFGLTQTTGGNRLGARRHLPPVLFLAGLTVLLLALARPQAEVGLPRLEGTVVLAFDVSGSMAADDLKPSRMEVAKAAAKAFVEKQPSTVKIGVVAFSDSGFTVQPPTNDQEAILASINRLEPQRATSLARGIFMSIDTILGNPDQIPPSGNAQTPAPTPTPIVGETYKSAIIVLISDGENTVNPDPLIAAQDAADRGIRIYPVGVGTPEGAILTVEGFNIHTRLEEATLQQIAEISRGTYYNVQSEEDLSAIYNQINPQLLIKPEIMEVTSVFAGLSVFVLLAGGVLSLLWFGRLP